MFIPNLADLKTKTFHGQLLITENGRKGINRFTCCRLHFIETWTSEHTERRQKSEARSISLQFFPIDLHMHARVDDKEEGKMTAISLKRKDTYLEF